MGLLLLSNVGGVGPFGVEGGPLSSDRATGGAARAATMLNGVRAGLLGLPLPLEAAHMPMEGGSGGEPVPTACTCSAGGHLA